jgi:two-component system cell cycle sensor histidine kinase PleC
VNPQGRKTRPFRSGRGLALGVGIFIAVTIIAACLAIWNLREDRIADELRNAQSLGIVLAEQTARAIQAVDLVVQQTRAIVLAQGVQEPNQFRERMGTKDVHDYLVSRLKNLPQANAIALIDDAGKLTNVSLTWPVPVLDAADREYFRYLRDHNVSDAFIGPPLRNKVNGAWTITIAHRINGPNGEFLGVAAGYVEAHYFADFYKAISTSDGESISLFRRDGTLISRFPDLDAKIGEKISPASPWYKTLADGGGTYRTPGYIGGVPRISTVQPVHGYPLAIATGISEDVALAPWRHQSTIIAIGALGAVVGFAILFHALAVQFRRLAQSEARFRDFALTSSDWFWETDELHRFTYLSEGIRGFGHDPAKLIGRTRMEFATERDTAQWQEHVAALNRHEPFRDFIYTRRIDDQIERTGLVSGNPFFDPLRRFLGYRGTARDITELKATEAQLREAMDHLNRVQRIAGIGSLEIDLTTETECINWSPHACKLFGLDHASVEPTPEFLLNLIHPDDRAKAKSASDRANATGTAAPPLEYRIVRPDGEERILYRENAIQYDDSGEPARRIVTYKDITEIKITEAQLRQTQDDLNHAQRLAKVGSDVWDVRTGEVVWSDETYRIFGVDPSTFIPTIENFLDLVVPEDRPGILARRQEILRGKCPTGTVIRIRRPDGDVRQVYSEAELVLDEDGKPLRWVGMRQDITTQVHNERSLRDAKEAAEAANMAKSQFLANTSHELRTPLNAILGFSEALNLGLKGRLKPAQAEYVALVHDSGQHLLTIINDILDLARVDAGKVELHEESEVDPRHLVDACIALTRESAISGRIRVSTDFEGDLPLLRVDATRLRQIVLNLLSNAIKFTKPGGNVVLAIRHDAIGGVCIAVRDTGLGMTPDEIAIALEPFGQVDSGDTRRFEGTGLGVPLAKRLTELHGGTFTIDSEKGKGTCVTVTIPAARVIDRSLSTQSNKPATSAA